MKIIEFIRSLKKVVLASQEHNKLDYIKNGRKAVDSSFIIGEPYNLNISDDADLMIGKNVLLRSFCSITILAGGRLILSDNVFFNNYCSLNCLGEIIIGENTIVGEGVKIYDHNHLYKIEDGAILVERELFKTSKVHIGKNCWIGSNVIILPNVVVGDNVIIGANNLVHKSIPSNSIVKADIKSIVTNS